MLEKHYLHEQNFDFPEENWDNFKASVLAGKYDSKLDIFDDNFVFTKEIIKQYLKGKCKLDINMSYETWLRLKNETLEKIYNENANKNMTTYM